VRAVAAVDVPRRRALDTGNPAEVDSTTPGKNKKVARLRLSEYEHPIEG